MSTNQDPNTNNETTEAEDHADIDATPADQERFQNAYERLANERAALSAKDLVPITVAVPTAVWTVLKQKSELAQLGQRVNELPDFDIAQFEKIEDYALALAYSQMLYNMASAPVPEVPGLVEEAMATRSRLATDAEALAKRGLVPGARLPELKGGNGYQEIAYDLGALVALLRQAWPDIKGKTAVTQDELTSAQIMAEKLLVALAERAKREVKIGQASDERARAFTLLKNAYDQAHRAAAYLHWGEDVSALVPSFYNQSRWKGRKSEPDAEQETASEQQSAPTATTPTNGSSAIPVGMPGASPLMD